MTTVRVRKGSTDRLTVYPTMRDGRLSSPTAADVRIGTPAVSIPLEGEEVAATVDPTDTTLASGADIGDTQLSLADASDVVPGRLYLVDDSGDKTVVAVEGKSGNTVFLTQPVLAPLASAAAFSGLAAFIDLTAEQTENEGRGLAIWRLTLDGQVEAYRQGFSILTTVFPLVLSPEELSRRPEARRYLDPTDQSGMELILTAWEHVLEPRIAAAGILDALIETPSLVVPAHVEACILLAMRGSEVGEERLEAQEARLARSISDLKERVDFHVAEDDVDEAPGPLYHDDRPREWSRNRLRR